MYLNVCVCTHVSTCKIHVNVTDIMLSLSLRGHSPNAIFAASHSANPLLQAHLSFGFIAIAPERAQSLTFIVSLRYSLVCSIHSQPGRLQTEPFHLSILPGLCEHSWEVGGLSERGALEISGDERE